MAVLSLVVPIYRNEENIPELLKALAWLAERTPLEAIFVIDGSPDRSTERLEGALPEQPFGSQLVQLSRNFGAFSAIAAGLEHGRGDWFAVLTADLQEPPELMLEFAKHLASGKVDVVVGQRTGREDPWLSRLCANLFWHLFRHFAVEDIPSGGADIFACTRQVRDSLLALREVDSSLISLLFWLGFRWDAVPFVRQKRLAGKSAWNLRKKIDYAVYSFCSFTDLPVRVLLYGGAMAAVLSLGAAAVVLGGGLLGWTRVSGHTALALLIVFYGGVTTFGLGLIGQYIWLALQNARRRPNYIVRSARRYEGRAESRAGTAP